MKVGLDFVHPFHLTAPGVRFNANTFDFVAFLENQREFLVLEATSREVLGSHKPTKAWVTVLGGPNSLSNLR